MKKEFFKKTFTNVFFYLLLLGMLFVDYYFSGGYTIFDAVVAFFVISIFLLILFAVFGFIDRDKKDENFPIKDWKWIIYVAGWVGVLQPFFLIFQLFLQPIFWTLQGFLYFQEKRKIKFFSMTFHKGIYYWGLIMIAGFFLIFSFRFLISFLIK